MVATLPAEIIFVSNFCTEKLTNLFKFCLGFFSPKIFIISNRICTLYHWMWSRFGNPPLMGFWDLDCFSFQIRRIANVLQNRIPKQLYSEKKKKNYFILIFFDYIYLVYGVIVQHIIISQYVILKISKKELYLHSLYLNTFSRLESPVYLIMKWLTKNQFHLKNKANSIQIKDFVTFSISFRCIV